ncbi:low molecular weight protein-tyrosine-phosphatase [Eisenbergiella tayi]|uniref:low molecular weight protein-tyrosine-phosphatase n=1 Tax=Eisenbergiella tayi TaxID=1432052 RepID=UPI0008489C91|nr:low molecular weight protein-tyrosine-phosphatase [Eisenbergiella tayi]ODR43343.1 protein-tyrosine-phosphatase [Eisenbergiella tayi]
MIKILFVCHGNICRSPMAEFILRDMVRAKGIANDFHIESAATSTEEIGNPVHHGTRRKLLEHGFSKEEISFKQARQMRKEDYAKFDYIIGMDEMNLRNIMRILRSDPENKVHLLLDYTDRPGAIADPWYTGNFEATYRDVCEGCEGFLESLGI